MIFGIEFLCSAILISFYYIKFTDKKLISSILISLIIPTLILLIFLGMLNYIILIPENKYIVDN